VCKDVKATAGDNRHVLLHAVKVRREALHKDFRVAVMQGQIKKREENTRTS
jgi:hypothetical protein